MFLWAKWFNGLVNHFVIRRHQNMKTLIKSLFPSVQIAPLCISNSFMNSSCCAINTDKGKKQHNQSQRKNRCWGKKGVVNCSTLIPFSPKLYAKHLYCAIERLCNLLLAEKVLVEGLNGAKKCRYSRWFQSAIIFNVLLSSTFMSSSVNRNRTTHICFRVLELRLSWRLIEMNEEIEAN